MKHYWNPPTGGALHALAAPFEAVFTDDRSAVDCDACLCAMAAEACGCYACVGNQPAYPGSWVTVGMSRMIVCATCGNKRCPHGTDHRNACTGSNEPRQTGSRYGGLATDQEAGA